MVFLPIRSVVYLRNVVIAKYGSSSKPFGRIFVITIYGSPTNPFRIFVGLLSKYGSPTNPFSSIFVDFCH